MLNYRMFSGTIPAGENAVEIIKKHLEDNEGFKTAKLTLDFVGFEAPKGTSFTLNNQKDKISVPSSEYFITPYLDSNHYMSIESLIFDSSFSGNIYYII